MMVEKVTIEWGRVFADASLTKHRIEALFGHRIVGRMTAYPTLKVSVRAIVQWSGVHKTLTFVFMYKLSVCYTMGSNNQLNNPFPIQHNAHRALTLK